MSLEPQIDLAGKGAQEVSGPTFCSKQEHLWYQTSFLWALSSLVLKTASDEQCMNPLGELLHILTVLVVKKLFTVRVSHYEFYQLGSSCTIKCLWTWSAWRSYRQQANKWQCLSDFVNSCHMHWEMQQPALLSIFTRWETSLLVERNNYISNTEHYA